MYDESPEKRTYRPFPTGSVGARRAYKVPQGSYFMMGDNRTDSGDRRESGRRTRPRDVAFLHLLAVNRIRSFSPPWSGAAAGARAGARSSASGRGRTRRLRMNERSPSITVSGGCRCASVQPAWTKPARSPSSGGSRRGFRLPGWKKQTTPLQALNDLLLTKNAMTAVAEICRAPAGVVAARRRA